MEPEVPLPHLKVLATCPYHEPARSSPYPRPTSHFLKIYLNIIIPSTPGFPQWSLSLRFPHQNPVEDENINAIYMSSYGPVSVATRSKAWFCGRSLAGIAGSNPAEGMLSVVSVVCCQVEVSVTSRSLVQRSPTYCGVSECDREVL